MSRLSFVAAIFTPGLLSDAQVESTGWMCVDAEPVRERLLPSEAEC